MWASQWDITFLEQWGIASIRTHYGRSWVRFSGGRFCLSPIIIQGWHYKGHHQFVTRFKDFQCSRYRQFNQHWTANSWFEEVEFTTGDESLKTTSQCVMGSWCIIFLSRYDVGLWSVDPLFFISNRWSCFLPHIPKESSAESILVGSRSIARLWIIDLRGHLIQRKLYGR